MTDLSLGCIKERHTMSQMATVSIKKKSKKMFEIVCTDLQNLTQYRMTPTPLRHSDLHVTADATHQHEC